MKDALCATLTNIGATNAEKKKAARVFQNMCEKIWGTAQENLFALHARSKLHVRQRRERLLYE